jgi:phage-related protein
MMLRAPSDEVGAEGTSRSVCCRHERLVRRRLTYVTPDIHCKVSPRDKPLVWLSGEVKTPPFSEAARIEAGFLLRRLQAGEALGLPHSRPMPSIGKRCHELRIQDEQEIWRIVYRTDRDAIVIAEVFKKKTQATPKQVLEQSQLRFSRYDKVAREE